MRKLALGVMMVLLAATPAHAERYAISCSGTVILSSVREGRAISSPPRSLDLVFVIDTDAQTVHRYEGEEPIVTDSATLARAPGTLRALCDGSDMKCTSHFRIDRVSVDGLLEEDGTRSTLSFDFDRRAGTVENTFTSMAGAVSLSQVWSLKCVSAAIPAV